MAPSTTEIDTLSLHDALPIWRRGEDRKLFIWHDRAGASLRRIRHRPGEMRSEEHTSELQSRRDIVCRLLLANKIHAIHKAVTSADYEDNKAFAALVNNRGVAT